MGGGAWPFLVGGVICLVNSVNERDLNLLNMFLKFLSLSLYGEMFKDLKFLLNVTV
jgi:hypothetical protein